MKENQDTILEQPIVDSTGKLLGIIDKYGKTIMFPYSDIYLPKDTKEFYKETPHIYYKSDSIDTNRNDEYLKFEPKDTFTLNPPNTKTYSPEKNNNHVFEGLIFSFILFLVVSHIIDIFT